MPRVAIHPAALTLCVVVTCAASPACKTPDPGPDLQILGETARVRSGDPVPSNSPWFDGKTLTLVAARGETLGFQVLHRGGGAVTFDAAHAKVRSFNVEPVTVKHGSTALYGGGRGRGVYPDVLVEGPNPTSTPAYFEISIDVDAPPGTQHRQLYVGNRVIDVELRIEPVQLPTASSRVWAYYDPRELVWAKLGTGTHDAPSTEERACIAMFRDYGVMLTPDLRASAWPGRRELLAGSPVIPTKISKDPATVGDDVRAWLAATRGTGQVPFSIPIDEPRTPEARENVRALAAAVRAAGGGPGKFELAVTDRPRPEYGDLIDLYITLEPKRADTHVRWTYNGAPPRAGSFVVDAVPPGPRTWGWLAWRWKIPIWYVWDALYWHDRHNRKGAPLPGRALDATQDATSFHDGEDHGNLDGVLALPGDATTPCRPTLRLAAIRRGMQDRALLELAAACNAEATAKLVDKLVPRALGDAPAKGAGAWPTDEAAWETARRGLLTLASCAK